MEMLRSDLRKSDRGTCLIVAEMPGAIVPQGFSQLLARRI